ncbi:MAG: site-specific integrase [Deltaproteobacteria bacterium]|nr:site-specific integrase [Deltaproteobacteria bacterium]
MKKRKPAVMLVPIARPGGLVPGDLIEKAQEYARAAEAPSTLRTYASSWKVFTRWCRATGLNPLPADPETIVAFIAAQGDRIRPVTIKKICTAISQAHTLMGFTSPTQTEPVRLTLQGLRRLKGVAPVQKKALRTEYIRRVFATMPDTLIGKRDSALLLLGFVTGLRRSELAALNIEDIIFEPEGAVLTIRKGKRDQEGRGRRVPVPFGQQEGLCPVRCLRRWTDAASIKDGPIFLRLDAGAPRARLSGGAVAEIVKRAVARAGLDPAVFGGHSLRRGFCSEAARLGAPERDIGRVTGHSSLAQLREYVEAGTVFQNAATNNLVRDL